MVDLGSLYPADFRPQLVTDIRTWYIGNFKDRFFTDPPTWFQGYVWMEAVYHLPFSFFIIPALLRGTMDVLPCYNSTHQP